MNSERWQQISRIFNRAISLDAAARSAYVKEKCGTDSELQAEIERLIESHEQAEDDEFMGGLAVEDVAEHFSKGEEQHALQKGQQFGAYVILDHLGTGGMGEVYLAKDSRLDRIIALKILAPDVVADKRRMQRFRQEAKMVSSLNQPNILTIFESGEVDGLTYIAAEFVDGETLRDHLRGKRLKLSEILDISIQMLAALDAAHEAQIVHRDMKPENVMIRRRDRVVKVLDFGLAKVTEKKKGTGDSGSGEEAITAFKTAPGLIMGTVNYMSPEQAQAHQVDARSDIWSTGVIIYEMVAGTKPFGGSTSAHTIVQILEKEPAPLAHAGASDVPEELQRIVAKAIAKDPDERYQTAKDMLIDLRNLKKRLELDAELERSATFAHPTSAFNNSAMKAVTRENIKAVRTAEPAEVETSKSYRGLAIALVAIVAAVAGVLGFNAWRNSTRNVSVVAPVMPAAAAPERTLTYWITVQKFKDGNAYQDPFDISGEINFEADYQIRLSVRSPQAGYLYVLNEGPSRAGAATKYVVVFPSATANDGSGFVRADQRVQIPEETWLKFDKEQGVEKLWLVFSEHSIPDLDGIKVFASARTAGLITDAALNRAVNSFLISHAADKVTVERGEKHTLLKTPQNVLVYAIRLEHH